MIKIQVTKKGLSCDCATNYYNCKLYKWCDRKIMQTNYELNWYQCHCVFLNCWFSISYAENLKDGLYTWGINQHGYFDSQTGQNSKYIYLNRFKVNIRNCFHTILAVFDVA